MNHQQFKFASTDNKLYLYGIKWIPYETVCALPFINQQNTFVIFQVNDVEAYIKNIKNIR